MQRALVSMALLFALPPPAGAGRRTESQHVVREGESLWSISRQYGCDLDQLRRANGIADDLLQPGASLRVPRCEQAGPKSRELIAGSAVFTHTVRSGDTLGSIARQYDSSIDDLRALNRLSGSLIRPGQVLSVTQGSSGRGRPIAGQSLGAPQRGQLRNAILLPHSAAYFRRRPQRAWGTNWVVHQVRRSTESVAKRFPSLHRLAIGDLSAREGGPIPEHVSHQSGRDVDLGFYFRKQPAGYPEAFVPATRKNLHFDATWALLTELAATRDSDGGVEAMYISYSVQKLLYERARERGVDGKTLARMLQYPRGQDVVAGIIRHEPGHEDHVHVRFACPSADARCR